MDSPADQLPELFRSSLARRKARWERFGDIRYVRTTDDVRGYPKGTVLFAGRLIPGYPHIGRIYRLEQGMRQALARDEILAPGNVRVGS